MNPTRLAPFLALVLFFPLTTTLADFGPRVDRRVILERLNVPQWHQTGHRGKGVKIAVLDTGFQGYRDHLGKALPATVQVRSFRQDGKLEARPSQHGILCGEVIHAVAPEAELLFANWDADHPGTFLDAVGWARQQGAQVISCSVIMPTWSDNEGNGDAHRKLTKLLGDECLLFAAAGNVAERHWCGRFSGDSGQWHQWKPGACDNRIVPWEMDRVSVEMMWQGDARYFIEVRDDLTGKPIAIGGDTRDANHTYATARWVPESGHTYSVRVRKLSGADGRFHLIVLGGMLDVAECRGSVTFPADGHEVIAVGAIAADNQRQPYSACGTGQGQTKPDLVAVVPFPSAWRDRPFSGTSAATPQAAGLAAILWSLHPKWSAGRIRETLTKSARRLGMNDHDPATGFGQARLPEREASPTNETSPER